MSGEFTSSPITKKSNFKGVTWEELKELEYSIVDGLAIFEGDIILGTEESITAAESLGAKNIDAGITFDSLPSVPEVGMVAHGVIISGIQYRWPDGKIHYTINSALPRVSAANERLRNAAVLSVPVLASKSPSLIHPIILTSIGKSGISSAWAPTKS